MSRMLSIGATLIGMSAIFAANVALVHDAIPTASEPETKASHVSDFEGFSGSKADLFERFGIPEGGILKREYSYTNIAGDTAVFNVSCVPLDQNERNIICGLNSAAKLSL